MNPVRLAIALTIIGLLWLLVRPYIDTIRRMASDAWSMWQAHRHEAQIDRIGRASFYRLDAVWSARVTEYIENCEIAGQWHNNTWRVSRYAEDYVAHCAVLENLAIRYNSDPASPYAAMTHFSDDGNDFFFAIRKQEAHHA